MDKQSSLDNKNQLKKCVSDLYKACEESNHNDIRKLVNEHLYSYSKLDIALRKLLLKVDIENEAYLESFQMLLKVFNVNYQNTNDKSTIVMEVCGKGEVILIQFLLKASFDDKLIEDIIDYSLIDNANCNFIHYIFYRNTNEHDAIDILRYFYEKYQDKPEHIRLFSSQLEAKDKGGNAPISILLTKGWHQMLKLYLSFIPFKSLLVDGNNNLMHCAIAGRSVGCLKLILFNSKIDDLKHKNKEGLTPSQYAHKKSLFFFMRIIDHYEKHYLNISFRKHYLNDSSSSTNSLSLILIALLRKEEYEEINCILSQLLLSQSISGDTPSYSITWNSLLIEYKSNLKTKQTPNNSSSSTEHFTSLLSFLITTISDNMIEKHNEDINGPIDIIVFNKGLICFINGELLAAIKAYSLYLQCILTQNDTAYYKWIIYVNSSFILIETFYSYNQITICHIIIEKIGEFLVSSYRLRNEAYYNSDTIDKVYELLNESELFHRFTPGWDESFCYLLLLKIMTRYSNKSLQVKGEYKKRMESCRYVNELKVFSRMKIMYAFLKIKANYEENTTKCLKKLNLFTTKEFSGDYMFFYYNSLGIINLKLKQYVNAEYLLKQGVACFRKCKGESIGYPSYKAKNEHLCKLKFNLALALFYQRKFPKAREILAQLTKMRIIQKNVFVWYRLGLCCLEMEQAARVDSSSSSAICKEVRMHLARDKDKEEEQDCFSVDLNDDKNSDNYDELYIQFEKEYGSLSKQDLDENDPYGDTDPHNHDFNKFLLHSKEFKKKLQSSLLLESIKAFKQVILLSKANPLNTKEVKDIIQFYSKGTNNNCHSAFHKSNPFLEKGTSQSILISSYYNLLFALSLKEDWIEMLFYVRDFISNRHLKASLSNDIKIRIVHYQIEALIHLHKEKEALETIQNYLTTYQNATYRFDYYSKGVHMFHSNISFKLNLSISSAIIHIRMQNLHEADCVIQNIFKTFIKEEKNLPAYMISLLIYFYISQGRSKMGNVLALLKNRKMLPFNQLDINN